MTTKQVVSREAASSRTDVRPSRRDLFAGAAVAALAVTLKAAEAQGVGYQPHAQWLSAERRLARRLTYGITLAETQKAIQLGYSGYLEYQLNYAAIDDSAVDNYIRTNMQTVAMTPLQLYRLATDQAQKEIQDAMIYRAINSKRQLYQRMVEFWNDHFNTYLYKDDVGILKPVDDRMVIRRFAMTSFQQLLNASARSPAMLSFLDNASSYADDPNQNYARELMELHTIGVNGGYTQQDVTEVARCFTGWTYEWDEASSLRGTFKFIPDWHDNGQKTVLGHVIPAGGGYNDGLRVLGILAGLPQTARFVGTKLAKFLLRYDPPQAVIDAVVATWVATRGDIKAVIRTILSRANLMAAPPKLKRPLHLVASTLRSLNGSVTNWDSLRWGHLGVMGQNPFEWAPPNGYPDALGYWSGFVLPRWNYAIDLADGYIDGIDYNLTAFLNGATTVPQILARINAVLFAGEIHPSENAELFRFLSGGELNEVRIRESIGIGMSMPSYQYY